MEEEINMPNLFSDSGFVLSRSEGCFSFFFYDISSLFLFPSPLSPLPGSSSSSRSMKRVTSRHSTIAENTSIDSSVEFFSLEDKLGEKGEKHEAKVSTEENRQTESETNPKEEGDRESTFQNSSPLIDCDQKRGDDVNVIEWKTTSPEVMLRDGCEEIVEKDASVIDIGEKKETKMKSMMIKKKLGRKRTMSEENSSPFRVNEGSVHHHSLSFYSLLDVLSTKRSLPDLQHYPSAHIPFLLSSP
jgi:hypothetical protein